MAPKSKFTNGEKVLCYHGPLLYEAKILKQEDKNGQLKHFIHYSGWNKSWDEWVPDSRILKITEDSLRKQNELEAEQLAAKKNKTPKSAKAADGKVVEGKSTRSEKGVNSPLTPVKTGKQRAIASTSSASVESLDTCGVTKTLSENDADTEDGELPKLEWKVELSPELKNWLVDDYHAICHKNKLISLPAEIYVDDVIKEYIDERSSKRGITINEIASLRETSRGIQHYFNKTLHQYLLYKFERSQYRNIIAQNPDKPVSEIYGPMHLLRLFVKLGPLLSFTSIDNEGITVLSAHFQDFVKFLADHADRFFKHDDYYVCVSSVSSEPSDS